MGRDNQEVLVKTRSLLITNPFYHVSTSKQVENKSLYSENLSFYQLNEATNDDDKKEQQQLKANSIYYSSPNANNQLPSYDFQTTLQLFNHTVKTPNTITANLNSSNAELNCVRMNQLDLLLDQTDLDCSSKTNSLINNPSKNWVLRKSSGNINLK